jgi:hypothetical protein
MQGVVKHAEACTEGEEEEEDFEIKLGKTKFH